MNIDSRFLSLKPMAAYITNEQESLAAAPAASSKAAAEQSPLATPGQQVSVEAGLRTLSSAMQIQGYQVEETVDSLRGINEVLWRENEQLKQQLGRSRKAAYWQFASFFTVFGVMAWRIAMTVFVAH